MQQRFIEPQATISGRTASGALTFEREGRPLPLTRNELKAVETLTSEPDLGQWLVGSGATLKHDGTRPYEEALRAHAGGDIGAAVSTHGRSKSMKIAQLEHLTFESDKLDPEVAARFAAKLPAGSPVIVKWRGKYYVRDGGEHLAAHVAIQRAYVPTAEFIDVQLVDLDKVQQPARPVREWAQDNASAMRGMAEMRGSLEDAAKVRSSFRELLLDRGIVTRDDERSTNDNPNRLEIGGGDSSFRVEPSIPGAHGYHDWQGRIVVEKDTAKRAADIVELLSREDAAAFKARPISVQNALLNHLSTLVHEELHGASPVTSTAYAREGIGIEEAATEILARKVVRELIGHQSPTGATALGLPTRKPDGSYRVGFSDTSPYFGSYNGFIGTLLKETGDVIGHDGVHAKVEAALLKTRSSQVRDRWTTPERQIREYAEALGLTGARRDELVQRLTREFPRSSV